MIQWEDLAARLGFKTENAMWQLLTASLRTDRAIGKFLGISTGAVRRRKAAIHPGRLPKSARAQRYRKSEKLQRLELVTKTQWREMSIKDIAEMCGVSQAYAYKFRADMNNK